MPTPSLLQRLKERKLVQWGVAYLAGAWVLYEVVDTVGDRWGLPNAFFQGLFVVLAIGFFITLVLAWYHGEKGRQRVSGPELLMVAALLVVAGGVLSMLPGGGEVIGSVEIAAPPPIDDDRPSIAVLPFDNFSTDSTYAFFADGMQEQILSTLSDISALRVISRSSVMQYAVNRPNSGQIAEELGITHLVEGSAQASGDRVRLTVQLIDAWGDRLIWSDEYDLELTAENLFRVESEVARQIAFQVGVALTPAERDQVGSVLTENTEAYLLYMQGSEAFLDERQAGVVYVNNRSDTLFQRAVELDQDFALAHAGLALSLTYTSATNPERYERARLEAERANSLLPGLGEARVSLGRYFLQAGRPEEAMRQFQAAEEEDPNFALSILELGLLQRNLGDFDRARRTLERAERLDPLSPVVQRALTRSHIFAHRYDEALGANTKHDPEGTLGGALRDRAYIHVLRGESDSARSAISALIATGPRQAYTNLPGLPMTVVRRLLTEEEHQTAFLA